MRSSESLRQTRRRISRSLVGRSWPSAMLWLVTAAWRVGIPSLAGAQQQPVPIPGFDVATPPAASSAPAPSATPPAASGTAVVIPAPPGSPSGGAEAATTPTFQQTPAKALVKLDSTGLSVRAKNSSLSQILRDVASASGMKVEGFSRDERVFGNFGPDEPHEVLSNLLDGSGYNVIMIGNTEKGTPKVLSLSPRLKPGQPDVAPEAPALAPSEDEGEQMTDDPADNPPDPPIPAPISTQLPAPDVAPPQPGSTDDPTVRTPQQILEDLQRLHPPDQPQAAPPNPPSP